MGLLDYERKDPDKALEQAEFDEEAYAHIYVIELLRTDTVEDYYYVGSTRSLKERIRSHASQVDKISKPVEVDGKQLLRSGDDGYIFRGIHTVENVHDDRKSRILYLERKKMLEIARELETENVLGGN